MTSTPTPVPPLRGSRPRTHPSTGRLVAIVAAVIAGIFLLMAAGLFLVGYRFASRIHISHAPDGQHDGTVRIETPLGNLRVQKQAEIDPKLLGMPIYPGAVAVKGQGARVDLDLDFVDKSLRVAAVRMETGDPMDKVVAFYRQEASEYSFNQKSGNAVEFHCSEGPWKKIIAITERRGKTNISLANVGEPEAN